MKYGAKAAWDTEEIEDKLNRGTDGIEIQLLAPDPALEMAVPLAKSHIAQIQAVHTPLVRGYDYPIDDVTGFLTLKKICEYIKIPYDGLHIICHHHGNMFKRNSIWYEDVVDSMRSLAKEYPQYTFCIENPSLNMNKWRNDNVVLVEDINMPNVGTCLDTCHALIADHANAVSLEDHFKANKDLCRHMHVCNASWVNDVYGRGEGHGTPFESKEDPSLKRIIALHKKYAYDTDIVYEIREDDYLNCRNYSITKESIGNSLQWLCHSK